MRALEPVARQRAIRRYRSGPLRTSYADSAEAVGAGELARAWWYYSVELVPGVVTEGQFPSDVPMLPRLMLHPPHPGVAIRPLGDAAPIRRVVALRLPARYLTPPAERFLALLQTWSTNRSTWSSAPSR